MRPCLHEKNSLGCACASTQKMPSAWVSLFVALLCIGLAAFYPQQSEQENTLVRVETIIPDILLDIRYATPNNFTGTVLYDSAVCLLRLPVALQLKAVQEELKERNLGLKVFDGYRPLSVQWKLWEIVPDPRYVADPREGSRHNRGAAIDLTIVDEKGDELPMGTEYDDFTERAHRDFTGLTPEEKANRALLDSLMEKHGFVGLPTEWWHFDAQGWQKFDILDIPFSEL